MRKTAVVMNMFYTGLGIARSLGERGIPVIGLTARRGVYGNHTRYARTVFAPDSREQPEALLAKLLELGKELNDRAIIFPTRDDDVVFLDRFREELSPFYILTVPEHPVIEDCLDKWKTYLCAVKAAVPTPKCWLIESEESLRRQLTDLEYPCVLKPVAAHHWRKGANWELVGGRKAVGVWNEAELLREYKSVSQANPLVLAQAFVPGADDSLVIAACYFDRSSRFVAGFNTRKLIQIPEGFGTGCIVQTANVPELFEATSRLLQTMRFTGIAEVEYKWDAGRKVYQLIEINPRPWDQHSLGRSIQCDLIYMAYCEHAGLPCEPMKAAPRDRKWIAEDGFVTAALQLLWRRDPAVFRLLALARGTRTYAIWSWRDPLPFLIYMTTRFIPGLILNSMRLIWSKLAGGASKKTGGLVYERRFKNENVHN